MAVKRMNFVPTAVFATSDTSLGYTSPAAGSGVDTIQRIHVVNTDSSDHIFTVATAAEAAGTELAKGETVRANSHVDIDGPFTLPASTTLHGHSDSALVNVTVNGVRDL